MLKPSRRWIVTTSQHQISMPADSGLLPAKQESDSSTLSVDAILPCSADSDSVTSNHRHASSILAQGSIFDVSEKEENALLTM